MRHPFPEQHHLLVVAPHRPEAQVAGLMQPAEQMHPALPGGGDPGRLERRKQLGAGGRSTALEQVGGDLPGAFCGRFVDSQLCVTGGQRLQRAGGGQAQHPADVLTRHQVQGAAHRPGSDDLAAAQRGVDVDQGGAGGPQPDRPFGSGQVLALHGQHPADHLRRAGALAAVDQLCEQP